MHALLYYTQLCALSDSHSHALVLNTKRHPASDSTGGAGRRTSLQHSACPINPIIRTTPHRQLPAPASTSPASEQKTLQFLPSLRASPCLDRIPCRPTYPGPDQIQSPVRRSLKITRSFDHAAQDTQLRPATPARTLASQPARPGTHEGLRGAWVEEGETGRSFAAQQCRQCERGTCKLRASPQQTFVPQRGTDTVGRRG